MTDQKTTTTILLIAASPDDVPPLQLGREFQAIDSSLREATYRDLFDIRQVWDMQAIQLANSIMRYNPRVIHFSGHGSEEGNLLFQRSDRSSSRTDKQVVADLFKQLSGVQCVVLNACCTEAQAKLIAEHVDVVVGTNEQIGDQDAIAFAAGFYEAVGYGRSVADAFELAKSRIALSELPDADVPVLCVRTGVDASQLFLHLPVVPPAGPTTDPSASPVSGEELESALTEFFLELFEPSELRQRIGFLPGGTKLRARLPAVVVQPADFATVAAQLLMGRRALSPAWFEALAKEIPGQRSYILAVSHKWSQWRHSNPGNGL